MRRPEKSKKRTKVIINAANQKLQDDKDKFEADKEAEREKKEFDEKLKDLKARAEEEVTEKLEQAERDRVAKEEADKVEKARQEALRPDKEKLMQWIQNCLNPGPTLKSKEPKRILIEATDQINLILQDAMCKTQEL